MDDSKYRVIFEGIVAQDKEVDVVKKNLAQALTLDTSKIEKLFSGGIKIIKKNSSHEACEKTAKIFKDAGALCKVEKEESVLLSNDDVEPPPLPPMEEQSSQANSGSSVRQADEKTCLSCGQNIKLNMLICPHCGAKYGQPKMGCLPQIAIALGIGAVGLFFLGIIAAIAIPNFIAYRNKAFQSALETELTSFMEKQNEYHQYYGTYALDLEALDYDVVNPEVEVIINSADENCYEAMGKHSKIKKRIWVDCNGIKEYDSPPNQ